MVTTYYPVLVEPQDKSSKGKYHVLVIEGKGITSVVEGFDITNLAIGLANHLRQRDTEFALDYQTPFDVWGDRHGFSRVIHLPRNESEKLVRELQKALSGK